MLFARGILAKCMIRNKYNQGKNKIKSLCFTEQFHQQISKHFERAKSSDMYLAKLRHGMIIHLVKIKLHLSAKEDKRNADFLVRSITFISFTLHSSSAQKLQAWMRLEVCQVRVKYKIKAGLCSYDLSILLFILQEYIEQICK